MQVAVVPVSSSHSSNNSNSSNSIARQLRVVSIHLLWTTVPQLLLLPRDQETLKGGLLRTTVVPLVRRLTAIPTAHLRKQVQQQQPQVAILLQALQATVTLPVPQAQDRRTKDRTVAAPLRSLLPSTTTATTTEPAVQVKVAIPIAITIPAESCRSQLLRRQQQ
jgi:hypothetical protein